MMHVASDISRARIDRYLATAPDHLRPILLVVRDSGCAWMNIPQQIGRFEIPKGRPLVSIIGDDLDTAMGPAGFHRKSIRRLLAASRFISIVAAEPQVLAYATPALAAAGLGVNGTIIETRPEFELQWHALAKAEAPKAQMILVSVKETAQ
ncbi:hypothetical protein MKK63_21075 [Methylobacterium sp. J-088]|uniref:hypothetical protein n=1 Tax=Methylobacterium sp. J-088 TaxID=2836664 RepID=UPI001FBA95CD|nr:hypothetical protein [Methylobacterium sp. J-088]MCJ2065187.1 hypothetical protein [Methylobacterium sp. J-088]